MMYVFSQQEEKGMNTHSFVCEVAEHLDVHIGGTCVVSLVSHSLKDWPKRIKPVDAHIALVRVLYEILSPECAHDLVPREIIHDPSALAAQIYVAVSRRKIGSPRQIAAWQSSPAFRDALCAAFQKFVDMLLNGVDSARLAHHECKLKTLRTDLQRVRDEVTRQAKDDAGSPMVTWGMLMSNVSRVLCLAQGLLRVPADVRLVRLQEIIRDATRAQSAIADVESLDRIVRKCTAPDLLN